MDDFDVVLGMVFLLEHQVIPIPSARCLVITESFPTIVQAEIRQPNRFKMISAMRLDENCAQGEPPFVEIPLGASEKLRETVPEDTLCVSKKYHGVMPNSWPKSSLKRRRTDHGIEPPSEAKVPAKNIYCTMSPELAGLQKPSKMLLNTGFRRPVQAPYGVHVLPLKKKDRSPQQRIDRRIQSKLTVWHKYPLPMLTRRVDHPCGVKYLPKSDIRPMYCRSQINVSDHVGKCHQGELLREEDTQWSENLMCQAAFNGLKQAMIEAPSLRVVGTTKTPKVEAEQFSCVFEEYPHHCVDGRRKNWVQLLKVTQFGHSAQTDSLIKRSLLEIKGRRHSVFPPLTAGPYVEDRPQVHRVGEECEQMADIARVCLEEASRPMEERVDQKRSPLEFEWMTKLPIDSATTPYSYLSTWTWRKSEKSRNPC
ncbi:RNA-directed DNA polymerase-like protein [Cucumis melo var. makuwa]|uniref:RNA-directed DNA polymerase-like protein n=1 Tax=Cucumis melo var. makuwa TaxID=1194695 RepID=A0A5D3DX28_CUCMM|nr:RNA-directed DNA polymerase-like protein [Cucumis melo var. makuwa]